MLEAIGIAAVVLAIIIALLLAIAATKPDTFRYERTILINAPAERIHPFVNDFRKWIVWSPYETKDPQMKRSYGARAEGLGATYGWDGDKTIGAGHMEITETAPMLIRIKLDFFRPFKASNTAEFSFLEQADGTRVVWTMRGANTFMGKVMSTVMNLDKMIGRDFEAGLQALKAAAEGGR